MMKKVWLLLLMLLMFSASFAHANTNDTYVDVKNANFDVRLNGVLIQNVVNQYPLIVYKDITYFPMTFADSRFLGVQTMWTSKDGLSITIGGTGDYRVYDTHINDMSKTFKARVITNPIMVNGIARIGGEYPFLSFRDVAYFPLTWEYAVTEFGWKYTWNKETGLSIQSREYPGQRQETLLNVLNRTTFSKSYAFEYEIVGDNRESISTKGVMNGSFRAIGGNNICTFHNSFELLSPLPYAGSEFAEGWGHDYVCEGAEWSSLNVNATSPTGFSDHPFVQNRVAILGENRKAVSEVKLISGESGEEQIFLISFDSASSWANRKIEVTINSKDELQQVVIKDKDFLGNYSLRMTISELNEW